MLQGWQIALLTIGGILLLLIFALCFGTVGVRMTYEDELTLRVSLFGIRKTIFPGKKEKDLQDVSDSPNPNRLWKKEQKRLRKAEKKAERKRLKEKKKAVAAQKSAAEPAPNWKETLDMILAILKRGYSLTKGKLHFEFRKLHIRIATGDAASTALLYGVAVQSAAFLLQWIQDHFNEIHRKDGDMTVEPDFLSQQSSLEVDFRLRVRLFRAIGIALGLYRSYISEKKRAKRRAKKRVAAKQKT